MLLPPRSAATDVFFQKEAAKAASGAIADLEAAVSSRKEALKAANLASDEAAADTLRGTLLIA